MVDKSDIERMVAEVDRENSLFADKSPLDPFRPASEIVGREREAKELVRALAGGRGFAAPFVSVYGRSGSGKSSVVRFVCDSLLESGNVIAYAFANLRMARTVAGCAMLVLEEVAREPAESRLALDEAMQSISDEIKHAASRSGRPFVLVLDEFDSIFLDTRGRPSDFCYRLLEMQEYLREHDCLMTKVAISNSAMVELDVDDRVRYRMGSEAEVPFGAYTKEEVLRLLHLRAAKAVVGCEAGMLERCAGVCADEHGDARRAMDLFKSACELAGAQGQTKLTIEHIDIAVEKLQKDRAVVAMAEIFRFLRLHAGFRYVIANADHST